jgi:Skp family chaperone for outer membrane proteins
MRQKIPLHLLRGIWGVLVCSCAVGVFPWDSSNPNAANEFRLRSQIWGQTASPQGRGLTHVAAPVGPNGQVQELYSASHALLVGVSRYDQPAAWPRLESIPAELDQVEAALRAAGFDTVERLANPTGLELRRGVENFIGRHGYVPGHRLVFFFSGHGFTLDEGTRGYFVPRDAPDPLADEPGFRRTALSMEQVATWARDITARHALFAFDSCFSGTIFRTRDREIPRRISQMTARPVREFISAGDAGETVPARSVFAPVFIRALAGSADLDKDGFVTGTELGNFIQREVIAYRTGQTPQFGKLRDPRLDEGDLVFAVRPEPAPPAAPAGADRSRTARWAHAKAPPTPSAAWRASAEALMQDWGIGVVFDSGSSGLMWARSQYDATAVIGAGGRAPSPWASPVRRPRVAYVVLQTVVDGSLIGKDYKAQVQAHIEALRRDGSRAPAEAQASVDALQQKLQAQFEQVFMPLLGQLAENSGLDFVFNASSSGIVQASPGLDITAVMVKLLDQGTKTTSESVKLAPIACASYLDIQRVASESALGRTATAQIQALQRQRQEDVNSAKPSDAKQVADAAQKDVDALTARLQDDFGKKLTPVLEQVSRARGCDVVFSRAEAGFIAADASLDITADVIRALDAAHSGR